MRSFWPPQWPLQLTSLERTNEVPAGRGHRRRRTNRLRRTAGAACRYARLETKTPGQERDDRPAICPFSVATKDLSGALSSSARFSYTDICGISFEGAFSHWTVPLCDSSRWLLDCLPFWKLRRAPFAPPCSCVFRWAGVECTTDPRVKWTRLSVCRKLTGISCATVWQWTWTCVSSWLLRSCAMAPSPEKRSVVVPINYL